MCKNNIYERKQLSFSIPVKHFPKQKPEVDTESDRDFYLSRRFKWQRLGYKVRLVAIVKLDLKVETSRLIKE